MHPGRFFGGHLTLFVCYDQQLEELQDKYDAQVQECSGLSSELGATKDNALLYLKTAREDKLNVDNRSVVNDFQSNLVQQLGSLSNTNCVTITEAYIRLAFEIAGFIYKVLPKTFPQQNLIRYSAAGSLISYLAARSPATYSLVTAGSPQKTSATTSPTQMAVYHLSNLA
ncbi:hypothetical protein Vadar_030355 [Vaccinium darrowii]|uniref:Uncharacterized protein n=1 Tax=Vaccinium darrowii TaxID=229202 RepID=A0ACB7YZE0_9ERIC|nr:hypothetical protein Vadar_030355 [Vaccinium darrowii]